MITPSLARMLIQEHHYRPITGRVLTLGAQTIAMSHAEALKIFAEEGLNVPESVAKETSGAIDNRTRVAKDMKFIDDQAFFKMLGVERVYSMDVTDYEGCDIVFDLNDKVPSEFYGKWDFIIDGGTFDHIFDVRTSFENITNLLSPSGRAFMWNAASNFTGAAYISFGPDMFKDYFTLNRFADCKSYIVEGDRMDQLYDWDIYFMDDSKPMEHFDSKRLQMVVVITEKAPDSLNNKMPIQGWYRPADHDAEYEEGRSRIRQSSRPILVGRVKNGEPVKESSPAGRFQYCGKL